MICNCYIVFDDSLQNEVVVEYELRLFSEEYEKKPGHQMERKYFLL